MRRILLAVAIAFLLASRALAQSKTMAERLGYPCDSKLLIIHIHADDLRSPIPKTLPASTRSTPRPEVRSLESAPSLAKPAPEAAFLGYFGNGNLSSFSFHPLHSPLES